jgi:hypothetical protein
MLHFDLIDPVEWELDGKAAATRSRRGTSPGARRPHVRSA